MENELSREKVIVIDFGGQYNQLVARRVRECNVYCEIYSYKTDLEQIKAMNPKGIILTGGPNSCYEPGAPTYQKALFELGVPVLGLCYGAQLMMHVLGGRVEKAPVREYGKTEVFVETKSPLFSNVAEKTICWMSHFDYISKTAPGFEIVAHTADCPVAAAENREQNPVPPRSTAYPGRKQDALQLCKRRLRLCGNLENGLLCGKYNPGNPGEGWKRQGASCTVRRG